MQKSLLLHNDWLINKISSSLSSFRRVHTIINFNTKSNGSISLFLSFFFHFLFLLCEPRKWIKLPAVSHADRSLFFINKWASSLGRAAPSLYSGIYLYDRERGAEAITESRIGLFDGIRMNGSTASSYATRKGKKKREGNKNCWITLPDQFMRRTREKPPSAMTW